jgi:rhomboid protease GluP
MTPIVNRHSSIVNSHWAIPIFPAARHNKKMFKRQRSGAVLCPSCGKLVGVQDDECLNCGRKNPGMWGFSSVIRSLGHFGFTSVVTWGCAILYVATLIKDPAGIGMLGMSILSPSNKSMFLFGASGAIPVFVFGRWWTILSAAWLHGNLLHIVFNMLWVRQLAPAVSEMFGTSRTVIIYTAASIGGFFLSSWAGYAFASSPVAFLRGASLTIGASAPIFGLLGALVAYGRRTGSSQIGGQAMTYAIILFVFGFIMPNVDNYAHLGGFLGGYASARAQDPLRPERISHVMIAVLCIAATAFAVIASIVTAYV